MDELDALIDQAVNDEAAPAAAEAEPVDAAAATAATEETAIPSEPAQAHVPADTESPEIIATPPTEEAPAVTPDAEASPPSPTETIDPATVAELSRKLDTTQAQLTRMIEQDHERAEQERIASLQASWAEMSPEERSQAQAEFVIGEAVRRVQDAEARLADMQNAQARAEQARKAEEARPRAIQKIAEHFGLPKEEHYLLEQLMDPISMARVAQARSEQLAKVMETRRESVQANPAFATGATGSGAALRPVPSEFADLDALLDHTLGAQQPQ